MKKQQGIWQLHMAVLLFGLSGLFGKVICQHSVVITWGRVVFSALSLRIWLKIQKENPRSVPGRTKAALAALGVLLAFHWSTFYQAIQVSTVAMGLISFSAFPIFVTFLEPLFTGKKPRGRDVALAFVAFGGILLATPLEGGGTLWLGALWGLLSGFSYALLGLFNQKWVGSLPAAMVSFWEQLWAAVILTPCLLWLRPVLHLSDWGGLLCSPPCPIPCLSAACVPSGPRRPAWSPAWSRCTAFCWLHCSWGRSLPSGKCWEELWSLPAPSGAV